MRISDLLEAVPVGSSTQPAPGTPPAAPAPGTPPAAPAPGAPPTASAPGAPPAKPSPEVQKDMQAMSDQFNALKLKYDQLQQQLLNPTA